MKTKTILSVLVLLTVHCLLTTVHCLSAVPSLINYQGVLKDSTGVPYHGNATIVFSIWDDSTNGNKLWEETQAIVSVSHGLFNVLLGSSIPIPTSVFAGSNVWLQVIANGNLLSPRRRIVSVGYAFRSEFADTAEYALSAPRDDDWTPDTAGFNIYRLTGNVGIGMPNPQYKLDVAGAARVTGFQMPTDASEGYVLTSDASGAGSWESMPDTVGFAQRSDTANVALISPALVPVGAVTAWLKSFPNTPPLPSNFVECNGQVLSDPASPFDGLTLPDLNGVGGTQRFLRGAQSSGTAGGSDSHRHSFVETMDHAYLMQADNGHCYINMDGCPRYTQYENTLPSYYEVVWIMRIK